MAGGGQEENTYVFHMIKCQYYVPPGSNQKLAMLGSADLLGAWNPERCVPGQNYDPETGLWEIHCLLIQEEEVEWKLALVQPHGGHYSIVRWEERDNRQIIPVYSVCLEVQWGSDSQVQDLEYSWLSDNTTGYINYFREWIILPPTYQDGHGDMDEPGWLGLDVEQIATQIPSNQTDFDSFIESSRSTGRGRKRRFQRYNAVCNTQFRRENSGSSHDSSSSEDSSPTL